MEAFRTVRAMEQLASARRDAQHKPRLTAQAPVFSRPVIRANLGALSEQSIGLFGTPRRKQAEQDLIIALCGEYPGMIQAVGSVSPDTLGTRGSQWEIVFHDDEGPTTARQQLRDAGGLSLQLPAHEEVFIHCRDGPGHLPSHMVRLVVGNLPADYMIPGLISTLLESAGYITEPSDPTAVRIRGEHGGEHRAELAAFIPTVSRLGVVVGVLEPPEDDLYLNRLPRTLRAGGREITLKVTSDSENRRDMRPPPFTPLPSAPVFVPAVCAAPQAQRPPPRQALLQPLDAVADLQGRSNGDRRGLGMVPGQPFHVSLPQPPLYPPGFGPGCLTGPPQPSEAPVCLPMPPGFHPVPLHWAHDPRQHLPMPPALLAHFFC